MILFPIPYSSKKLIVFLFVSKHRMSSIMTVSLNLFLSCQDVGNLDGYFPVFTCFSVKGSARILTISSEKHVIPHKTQKEEEISSKPSKCFSWSLWIRRQKFSWLACCSVFRSNWIQELHQANKQLSIVLIWYKFLTFCNNHSSFASQNIFQLDCFWGQDIKAVQVQMLNALFFIVIFRHPSLSQLEGSWNKKFVSWEFAETGECGVSTKNWWIQHCQKTLTSNG